MPYARGWAQLNRDAPMLKHFIEELDSVIARDPAAGHRLSVFLLYPSVHVMLAYRLSHRLWRWRLRFVARFIMQVAWGW